MDDGINVNVVSKAPLSDVFDLIMRMADRKFKGIHTVNIGSPIIVSKPGIGKSKVLEYKCSELGYGHVSRNMGTARLEKFGSIPKVNVRENPETGKDEAYALWTMAELINECWLQAESHPNGVILMLDDWHVSSKTIKNIGFQLFTEFALDEHKLPPKTFLVLAMNDSAKSGLTKDLASNTNRLFYLNAYQTVDTWVRDYAMFHNIHPAIITALKSNTDLFHGEEDCFGPWPSPRQWTNFGELLFHEERHDANVLMNTEYMKLLCFGHVGLKATAEFMTELKVYNEFRLNETFETGVLHIPENPITLYGYTIATTTKSVQRIENGRNENVAKKVLNKLFEYLQDKHEELLTIAIRILVHRNREYIKYVHYNIIVKYTDFISELDMGGTSGRSGKWKHGN